MPTPEIHHLLIQPLHGTGVSYMITRSVAAIAYGEPRMTNAVDLVLGLSPGDGEKLITAFPSSESYVLPLEVIEEQRQRPRHGHFNIIHHETGLRAYDPLHEWAFADQRRPDRS